MIHELLLQYDYCCILTYTSHLNLNSPSCITVEIIPLFCVRS